MSGHGKILFLFEDNIELKSVEQLFLGITYYPDFIGYELTYKNSFQSLDKWDYYDIGSSYSNNLYLNKQSITDVFSSENHYYFSMDIIVTDKFDDKIKYLILTGDSGSAEFFLTFNHKKISKYLNYFSKGKNMVKGILSGHDMNIIQLIKNIENKTDYSKTEGLELIL